MFEKAGIELYSIALVKSMVLSNQEIFTLE